MPLVYVDAIMDLLFLFEIFINFFKATPSKGKIATNFKRIAWNYVSYFFFKYNKCS